MAHKTIEQRRAYANNYAKKHGRKYWLRWNYGIDEIEFDAILAAQGGVCMICGGEEKTGRFCVDHDHAKGKKTFRGILCRGCNTGLGGFKDNIKFLKAAALYLEFSRGRRFQNLPS